MKRPYLRDPPEWYYIISDTDMYLKSRKLNPKMRVHFKLYLLLVIGLIILATD